MNPLTAITTLPPEMQMLCACCRVHPRDEDVRLQTSLAALVDADKLLALAIRQRVEPLLYHHLKRHAPGTFPEALLQTLAARAKRNTFNTLNAIRLNVQLARMLREHGIPFLPLKGVTLAQRYYGEVGVRHCNDIDFWVPEHSLDAVRSLLIEQGCRLDVAFGFSDVASSNEKYLAYMHSCHHHEEFIHPSGVGMEAHWRLSTFSKSPLFNPIGLLATGDPIEIAGEPATMMASTPLLLYLCMHGASHGWFRLKWLVDLPQVLESRNWDWPQVIAEAERANCLNSLLLAMQLSSQLFGYVVPEPVACAIKKQRLINWQIQMVLKNLGSPQTYQPNESLAQKFNRYTLSASLGFIWQEFNLHWHWRLHSLHHKLFTLRQRIKPERAQ
jgi:hypothetical protein